MKFEFLGWCYEEEDGKVVHDKLWGVFSMDGIRGTFWGKRTATKFTFKRPTEREIEKGIREKTAKGYQQTTVEILEEKQPGWAENFESEAVLALMGDFFHGKK